MIDTIVSDRQAREIAAEAIQTGRNSKKPVLTGDVDKLLWEIYRHARSTENRDATIEDVRNYLTTVKKARTQ